MSKRLGNAVDPFEILSTYGADATRWYMISNSQPWDNLKFDRDGVDEVRRKFFGTLYNTYSFFALYANVDGFTGQEPEVPMSERPEIDRWIISLLNTLVRNVTESLENYDPTPAARMIQEFVCENLSNWYVRLNRKRFWGGGLTRDKLAAYQTLYTCLETVSMLSAPFAPFISDRIFRDLNAVSGRHTDESVHLSTFPVCDSSLIDGELEQMMSMAQQVSSMVLALRRKVNIKVRQPLTKIPHSGPRRRHRTPHRSRQGAHYERSECQGNRTDRKYDGTHHQAHQAQLQDPRSQIRQTDEADRSSRSRVLTGSDSRDRSIGGNPAGRGRRKKSPSPLPISKSPRKICRAGS